jgi:pimeloyl-ACP methyl ester carboxylesterase
LLKATEDSDIAGVITWASIAGTTHFWQGENVAKVLKDGVVWVLNSRTKQKLPLCKAYYDDLIENAARLDLKQRLPHLKIPVLLIHGEADNVVPPERLKDLQYLLPHSQSYLVPEANHTFGGKHPFAESVLPPHTQIIVEQSYQFIHEVCSKSGYFVA